MFTLTGVLLPISFYLVTIKRDSLCFEILPERPNDSVPSKNKCLFYLMSNCRRSGAKDSLNPSTANFDAQYTSSKGIPIIPPTELLLMMCPLCFAFMLGSTALIKRRVPKKFTLNMSWAILIGTHSTAEKKPWAALLTKSEEKV